MVRLISIITLTLLTGCATIIDLVPSFWDDNQSAKIIDVRQKIHNIECSDVLLQKAHADLIISDLQWFELYSESKGNLQKDVIRLINPIQQTAADWAKRANEEKSSVAYCNIKKKLLTVQIDKAASAVLGRY